MDGKGAEVSPKKRGDSIAFHNVGGEPLPEDSTVTTVQCFSDLKAIIVLISFTSHSLHACIHV